MSDESPNTQESQTGKEYSGSRKSRARADCCGDWRYCEPPCSCRPCPPDWDPYCGPRPYYGRHQHHHRPHHHWPMPGGEFFESMMNFAASAAGSRGRWWQAMADAAHYARKDYMCGDPCYDPCYDPCAPNPAYCDPCAPPQSYCDPCAPQQSYCDPCATQYDRCEELELVNIKGLSEALRSFAEQKLKKLSDDLDKAEDGTKEEKVKEYARVKAKTEAANDAVIHAVKLARVAEAMRRKQWSRGSGYQRRY
jgi:hypothetical protein